MIGGMAGGLGGLIVGLTVVDLIWTTLTLRGAGPFTRLAIEGMWSLAHRTGRLLGSRKPLAVAGTLGLPMTLTLWIGLTWLGWTLVFCGSESAVVNTDSSSPADLASRAYFAGYAFITLGIGDFRPGGAAWQMLAVLAAIDGFLLVTLSLTYLMPLISAAVEERRLALTITSLGRTPDEILRRSWDGSSFDDLAEVLSDLSVDLTRHGQLYLAYPLLHTFDSGDDPDASLSLRLAALDEALTVLAYGIDPSPPWVGPSRRSITAYLRTLRPQFLHAADPTPPAPSLEELRRAGVPAGHDAAFARQVERLAPRRRMLLGLLREQGWDWDDVAREGVARPEPDRLPE